MKRNGMCPICYLKKIFTKPKKITQMYIDDDYGNSLADVPPMGWSSWNTFKNNIDEDLIYETGVAMKEKGLIEAGYTYINLDDCWHSSMRDCDGKLQGDLTAFSHGIPALVKRLNALGLKVGIYSSNGTLTCEDLPASLGNEQRDADTFAEWGIEYFKYDFCHNKSVSSYAPLVYALDVTSKDGKYNLELPCTDAILDGSAKFMDDGQLPTKHRITGLDACGGSAEFKNVYAEEDGEYILTLKIRKKGDYEKFLLAEVNGRDYYGFNVPSQNHWNVTARFQRVVKLKKGVNTVKLFNPILNRADSAMLEYYNMGQCLKTAAQKRASATGEKLKPIVYSICEWGANQPYKWGRKAGNLWRTTGDIFPQWWRILSIYDKTVDLYAYAGKGGWNDPDMLEVGNGKLTHAQNVSHFNLWCMMCAPLILGNDVRSISDEVLKIVTDKDMIAINRDASGKPAKRVKHGNVDVLAKPLEGGRTAVMFFNRGKGVKSVNFDLNTLCDDAYVAAKKRDKYILRASGEGESIESGGKIKIALEPFESKVYVF